MMQGDMATLKAAGVPDGVLSDLIYKDPIPAAAVRAALAALAQKITELEDRLSAVE